MRLGSILGSPNDRLGLMLLAKPDGILVGRKQQMLDQVVPSVQEYGSAPVYRERTFAARPTGGYGERVQSAWGDRRYYWGMDIQVHGGLFGKGPLVHPIMPSPVPGGPIYKFIDALHGTALTQFILAANKVYRRADDTAAGQTQEIVFGAAMTDAACFQGGYAGAQNCLYVTCAIGAAPFGSIYERVPAGTYTLCALPSGFGPTLLEVVGTELWAADPAASVLRKVTSDPKVAANWSGPFFVGDPSVRISAIRQTANQLVIFKEDGTLYTLNSDGSVNDLFPGLTSPVNPDNGLRAVAWMNALWFRAGPTFYRLDMPGANLEPTGPGKLLENGSEVQGEVRAFCGWGGYRAYCALWNPINNTSYLLKYGNWEVRESEEGTSYVFDDQFDGAEAHWIGRKATAMGISGASGTDRLYVGFADGGWDWIKLVQQPLTTGSGAEFNIGPAEMVFPLHHAMFQADLKHWLGFSIFGPVVRAGDEATLSYRVMGSAGGPGTDPTGDFVTLGEFTANGQRIPAPSNLAGNALQLKVALSNTDQTTTPVIEIVAIHERVLPAFKRDISGTVDGRSVISRLDGAAYRPQVEQVHQAMMNAAAFPGSLAIELPDETINEVAIFGYGERLLPMQAGGGHGWQIDFEATQFRILTIYGIVSRLRGTKVGDLRGYNVGSLRYL